LTSLAPRATRAARSAANARAARKARRAGTSSAITVSQFDFKYATFRGASVNRRRKSRMKTIQMPVVTSVSSRLSPRTSSTSSSTNHTSPRITIGISRRSSN
jgi:hypothetical protein